VLRQLIALLVAGAITFGNIGASASTAPVLPNKATASGVVRNEPPLKPGGSARIRQAQGIENVDIWVFTGLIVGAIIWVLVGNDNDDSDSTNGTGSD
jgi:hypothetical protein